MRNPVIIDTGVLYAALDRTDKYHEICAEWLTSVRTRPFVVSSLVVAEVCYWLHESPLGDEGEAQFLSQLGVDQQFKLYTPSRSDLERMSHLVRKYKGLGGTDASVVAAAENYRTKDIATVDRRHFAQIIPRYVEWFNLHPEGLVP
ncbi:type II toxin-antitoxin system VapC family toxin [Amycolatopsis sp. VC5-11]|uniref:type II toxin-antitoxin system VapC family toxin n=1 Tax=Amycolatopsis sp. VC5-11 TaxID=3120156 RepID=UPI00300AF21E